MVMTVKNKYVNRSKISEKKFREIIRLFALDLDASQIANISDLNRNTVNRYLKEIRRRIAEYCKQSSPLFGEVEIDESYFGARRIKGRRGRGALGKTIVFGIFKRNGKVYTEIVPNCARKTLQGVIRGRVELESVIHSDGWRGYDGLVDLGYKKHFRVNHGSNEFVQGKSHINGIESFWGYAKTRLSRFRGMRKSTFHLHLKECEFRFNHRRQNLYTLLIKIIRENPLF
jgi:transposase